MVYNTTRMVKLPHHNSSIYKSLSAGSKSSAIHGTGTGSVLLRTGGGGAASSYMDIDDYIATTGINPYARSGISRPKGKGISSNIASKLSKLNINTVQPLRKNIVMSM